MGHHKNMESSFSRVCLSHLTILLNNHLLVKYHMRAVQVESGTFHDLRPIHLKLIEIMFSVINGVLFCSFMKKIFQTNTLRYPL